MSDCCQIWGYFCGLLRMKNAYLLKRHDWWHEKIVINGFLWTVTKKWITARPFLSLCNDWSVIYFFLRFIVPQQKPAATQEDMRFLVNFWRGSQLKFSIWWCLPQYSSQRHCCQPLEIQWRTFFGKCLFSEFWGCASDCEWRKDLFRIGDDDCAKLGLLSNIIQVSSLFSLMTAYWC